MKMKSESLFITLWKEYTQGIKIYFIFSEASKITGMLMELDQNTRLKLLTGKPEDLANIIKAAYTELLKIQN
jgi:hypothetical protein